MPSVEDPSSKKGYSPKKVIHQKAGWAACSILVNGYTDTQPATQSSV